MPPPPGRIGLRARSTNQNLDKKFISTLNVRYDPIKRLKFGLDLSSLVSGLIKFVRPGAGVGWVNGKLVWRRK